MIRCLPDTTPEQSEQRDPRAVVFTLTEGVTPAYQAQNSWASRV
jgi:hypothetical protein